MADQPWTKRWVFFIGVTLMLALPVAMAYFYLGNLMSQNARQRHKIQLGAQLNLMQEQLYDTKWDALADTFDDTLHLGLYDEAQLLRDTLMTYVYPDGRSFVEGIAIVNPDGSLRPSRLAAVIDDQGRPLDPTRLLELKKTKPWLENPWLPSYEFVIRAFAANPELDNWLSPFIQAPGRLVLVAASVRRDMEGRVACAVFLQHSIKSLWRDLQAPVRGELDLWLMDRYGTLGLTTSELAAESAAAFKNSGQLEKLLATGSRDADQGRLGISGEMKQVLRHEPSLLTYRSLAGDMLLGAAVRESVMGTQAATMLRYLGIISLWALLILAAAGAIYTVASLREQARMVEKDTLRRYAGTVSHRVRNDLATVMGNLELVSTGRISDPDRIKETLEGPVEEALGDIQATVEELERLSRGEVDLAKGGQLGFETMYESTEDGKGGGNTT